MILASASPRRRKLLEEAGIAFVAAAADVEEHLPERGDPHEIARENARLKAAAVVNRGAAGCDAVLGADTVVALDDTILGKPRDEADARRMLGLLSGTKHRVVTGVVLAVSGRWLVSSVETKVTMRRLSDEEIDTYVASGECMGKAGAYAIQETADRFVTGIDGPYDNVVGLPVDAVRELMREADL